MYAIHVVENHVNTTHSAEYDSTECEYHKDMNLYQYNAFRIKSGTEAILD